MEIASKYCYLTFSFVNCRTIIEKIRCDYVHRRSPGGRLRGCCGERGRFGRGLGVVEGRQDDGQRHIRRLARRHLHLHLRLRLLRLRRYCVHRRTETTRACSSEIRERRGENTLFTIIMNYRNHR